MSPTKTFGVIGASALVVLVAVCCAVLADPSESTANTTVISLTTPLSTPSITQAVPSITGPAPLFAGEAPNSNPQGH